MILAFFQSMLMYSLLLTPFYVIGRILFMGGKKQTNKREGFMLLFFIYCVCIFSQTIIPKLVLSNGNILFETKNGIVSQNFVPFRTITQYIEQLNGPLATIAFYNLAGNIVLFIPFGFMTPLLWVKMRNSLGMVMVAIAIPVFIEGTQFFIGRSVDIDDVILNTAAIIFGYGCWKLCMGLFNFIKRSK